MQVFLIRHGKTQGNLEGRYVGSTDEPLCPLGAGELLGRAAPPVERLYSSPMRRCLQSAQLLYPRLAPIPVDGLRESDFGDFEYRTYEQLQDCPAYRAWIASGGRQAPPGGETSEAFRRRCLGSFLQALASCRKDGVERVAFLIHGGVMMALLEMLADPLQPFYHWQAKNGGGWAAQAVWRAGEAPPVRLSNCKKWE